MGSESVPLDARFAGRRIRNGDHEGNMMIRKLCDIPRKIEEVLLPWADHVSSSPTLAAIRSALVVTLPLMFLGSLAELLNSFPLPSYQAFMAAHFGPDWPLLGNILKDGTFSVMSLIMVFSLAHHLTLQFNGAQAVLRANPVIAGLVAFASFFCLLQPEDGALPLRWLGVAGLFVAILVGILCKYKKICGTVSDLHLFIHKITSN